MKLERRIEVGQLPRDLLTVPEACEILRVSRWTFARWTKAKKIRTFEFSARTTRVSESELVEKLGMGGA